jgi:aspartate racemase
MIGIVGGVGPYAGLDLTKKVFDQTITNTDQEHLPVALLSVPGKIVDRTEFILGNEPTNPAYAMAEVVSQLERLGATVVGIPCNTAHAPPIFDVITAELEKAGGTVRLLHMIEEVAGFIRRRFPRIETVGVLSTTGTNVSGVYPHYLEREGLHIVQPDEKLQGDVHAAIYDPEYGVKARSNPVTEKARDKLLGGIVSLQREGAQAVILGCTEIPRHRVSAKGRRAGGHPRLHRDSSGDPGESNRRDAPDGSNARARQGTDQVGRSRKTCGV